MTLLARRLDRTPRNVQYDSESYEEEEITLEQLSEAELDDSEAEVDNETSIRKGLEDVPFGVLVQAQKQLDTEAKAVSNGKQDRVKVASSSSDRRPAKRKRDNKNGPMETTSKRPVGRNREAVEVHKIDRRDPRFHPDITGKPSTVEHRYDFLNQYRQDELKLLKESIRRETDPTAKGRLEKTLSSIQSRQQAAAEQARRQRVNAEYNRSEKEAAATRGKTVFYLKESEKNKLYLKDKFDSIKDTKKIDKYLEKKRKRRSQKDKKQTLPT